MTTKIKIIAGFSLMVILLATLSAISYGDLQSTAKDVIEYDRLAKFNASTSDLTTDLSDVEGGVFRFLDDKKAEHMDFVVSRLDLVAQKIQECQTLVARTDRRAVLEQLSRSNQDLRTLQQRIRINVTEGYRQYSDVVIPSSRELGKKLLEFSELARTSGVLDTLFASSNALHEFTYVRSVLSRFAESRSTADAERTQMFVDKQKEAVAAIVPQTATGKKLKADVDKAFNSLNDSVQIMRAKFAEAQRDIATLRDTLKNMSNSATKLSDEVDAQSRNLGEGMKRETAKAQKELLIIVAVGLLLGIACAIFIVFGLIKVLREMSDFAGAVAKGDFGYRINIREKGEIGAMVTAMRDIPRTLEDVISQARNLANSISSGHMRERLNASKLPGSFGEIATSTNAVGDAYLSLLDAMDLPIMACDTNNSIVFLNRPAQNVVGGNHVNRRCADLLKAPECGTSNCVGNCSVSKNGPHSAETVLSVGGKQINVYVTSLPLRDLGNKVVGYVEVLTDLTAIRTQQAAVMKAVAQASEISDRVAAASEELAAQVEQISRGSERQRSRVESTASAMSEMNSTVLEVARNAGQASERSEDTRKRAEGGAELVNSVVRAINTVNTVANHLQTNMQELGHQAESIGGVMNVISDIADQTNLLALNAAIEAARAGEAGRGFAVVADEVRKLAENTMRATQEVGANINAIQNSAKVNIDEVGNAAKSVTEATDLANSSGTALKEIVELAAANSSIVTSIATAAEQQSATSEEINQAVEEISRITNETSDGMVQSSAAVQDLSRMAQELRRVMETLR